MKYDLNALTAWIIKLLELDHKTTDGELSCCNFGSVRKKKQHKAF